EILAHYYIVDILGMLEWTAGARDIARRAHVGVGVLAPAQVEDSRGLARSRAEERGIRGVNRGARVDRGLAPHPLLAGRKFDVLDIRPQRPQNFHRRPDRL